MPPKGGDFTTGTPLKLFAVRVEDVILVGAETASEAQIKACSFSFTDLNPTFSAVEVTETSSIPSDWDDNSIPYGQDEKVSYRKALFNKPAPREDTQLELIGDSMEIRIENWTRLSDNSLHGEVHGHPRFDDGEEVTTSPIVGQEARDGKLILISRSGSRYVLGSPDFAVHLADARDTDIAFVEDMIAKVPEYVLANAALYALRLASKGEPLKSACELASNAYKSK